MNPVYLRIIYLKIFWIWIFIILFCVPGIAEGLLRVHFIDVGYGDSILVQISGQANILIDAGTEDSAESLVAYLKAQEIKRIHRAILTHPHKNHFGGYLKVLQAFDINAFFLNGDRRAEEGWSSILGELSRRKILQSNLKRGDSIPCPVEDCTIQILHPKEINEDVNDSSLVIFLKYQGVRFLFTADVAPSTLDELAKLFPEITKSQFVQLPHHGRLPNPWSHPFENPTFLVSYGTNPFGAIQEENLQHLNARILRTDKHGTIVLQTNGFENTIQTER